ncbi:hypothetical protein diail_10954 [Diaporthe ilicicola]|nr:hypothetical protein diail_10954 [Diaporthe ilicicola]
MGSDIWSSTSSDEEKWQPNFLRNAPAPAPQGNNEDIQILLLGPPGCGKTSLQLRYTLRQFSKVVPSGAQLMGCHRHVSMPGGSEVHLIIHEFPTGSGQQTSSMMDPYSPDDISRQDTLSSSSSACQAEVHRRKLLEQSDAVMLLFNPWSKESFEWVNGSVVGDIINTGRKKKLTTDIVNLLDGLTAAIPEMQRSKSTRSIKSFQKMLPRMPSSPGGSGITDASLFSGLDEKKERDRDQVDYKAELKRISLVVEGSALKRAEFMIHEQDLPPSPPEQSPTPKPLIISGPMSLSEQKLPTIREVDSYASLRRGAAASDNNHRGVSANNRRRDSAVSFRTTSSAYSQASSTVVETRRGSSLRDSKPFTLEDLVDAHSDPDPPLPERPPEQQPPEQEEQQRRRRATLLPPLPTEDLEIPVLVVASMTDRLRDSGGDLPRMVSAQQGQELARRFGPNCAYIEVSARSNANVDEAYGLVVDQVMKKRAESRRPQQEVEGWVVPAGKKIDEIIIVEEEDLNDRDENDRSLPARVVRTKRPQAKSRSCMPAWWNNFFGSVFSWGPSDKEVSAITFEDIGVAGSQAEETKEDVWGETVATKSPKKASLLELRKSGVNDSRQSSSSTTSTALSDALQRDSIDKMARLEKTNGSMDTAAPVTWTDEDEKKSRLDEALFDKLDRKLSKNKARPDSMTLGRGTPKGNQSDSSDEEDHKSRRNEAILDKVSRKIGLDAGPLPLDQNPQPPLPVLKDVRPLSVDSSLSRSFTRNKSIRTPGGKKHKADHNNHIVFLTNYAPSQTIPIINTSNTVKELLLDEDTGSSIITAATSTIPQKQRQHTSLISEIAPSIPPLRFDTIRLDDRRFTVMIRLAEQELEQQRQRARKLVRDDDAKAAPITRSSSVGPTSSRNSPRRARGVGTNVVGAAKKRVSAALGGAGLLLPVEPARGKRMSATAAAAAQDADQKKQHQPQQNHQQQQQEQQIRADQEARAKALNNRRMVPKRSHASIPAMPPRRAASVRDVVQPTPASRPRTRPSSEARPHGRPVPVWI